MRQRALGGKAQIEGSRPCRGPLERRVRGSGNIDFSRRGTRLKLSLLLSAFICVHLRLRSLGVFVRSVETVW